MNRDEELKAIPPKPTDPSKWPPGVRTIGFDETDAFGVDIEGTLHWHGKPVEIRRPIELTTWQAAFGILAALATAVTAAMDVLAYFWPR